MNAVRSIRVTSNTESVLKALSVTFTNSHTVVYELIQNAARAGASCVWVTHDPAARTLTVEDDGIGIADPSKLLAIAESGWDLAVQTQNSPYGLGWISALFAAEEVEVESLNVRFQARTEDLLALRPVDLKPASRTQGARITLHGLKASIGPGEIEQMRQRLSGFAIPVVFNGAEWERPLAIKEDGTWVDTPEGKVRIALDNSSIEVFLQGMRFDMGWNRRAPTVIHLDPRKWFGRMPDRTELIDRERALRAVAKVTADVARQQLQALKDSMDGRDFVDTHAHHCRTWGCLDMLNDIDWLPGEWLEVFSELPRQMRYDDDTITTQLSSGPVSSEQIGPIVLQGIDTSCQESNWAASCYAWRAKIPMLAMQLHPGHWIYSRTVDVEEFEVEIEQPAADAPRVRYSGNWSWGDLTRVPVVAINGPLARVELPDDAGLCVGDRILVTEHTDRYVLLQLNDYRDDDRHEERVFDEDAATFRRAIRRLAGNASPEAALIQVLDDAGLHDEVSEILKTSGPLVLYHTPEGKLDVMSNAAQ
jgi:hypothetical protein